MKKTASNLNAEVREVRIGNAILINMDCIEWLRSQRENSFHAVVTDPPFALREYSDEEKTKLRGGSGGVWRHPPALGGSPRAPVPRFTTLSRSEREDVTQFFKTFSELILKALVPGGHVFVATNPLLSHLVYVPFLESGFEKRGEIIRLVQTLRGGDRPKNAHEDFADVTVMPRSGWEPWGLFRKPLEGTVEDNLRRWKTGGLRRESQERPFTDVIPSAPTHKTERALSNHPSLKPQKLMRALVRAALPLGEGVILDPFMGGGSTIAAAEYHGYRSVGVEVDPSYFEIATSGIPGLTQYNPTGT